jgi:hypothetical protein
VKSSPCQRVRDELPWFVGGDLPAERERATADHLRDCRDCRRHAAALQQSTKALGEAGRVAPDGADEAMFAVMHASILAAVGREEAVRMRGEAGRPAWRWAQVLAAAAMFLFGWWLVDSRSDSPVFGRPPITSPIGVGAAKAVPYAGDRVQLQPLGDEWPAASGGDGFGPGMMGRWRLRTLEDLENPGAVLVPPLPSVPPETRSTSR